MARPLKKGLDYIPLEVGFFEDDKIALVSEEFGIISELIAIKLFLLIFSVEGYYTEWNDDKAALFAKRVLSGERKGSYVSEVVKGFIRRGLFDKRSFDEFHILTSRAIQVQYCDIKYRSKQKVMINQKYNLLEEKLVSSEETIENTEETIENTEETIENTEVSTQSKGKEIKVNKRKKETDNDTEPANRSKSKIVLCEEVRQSYNHILGEQLGEQLVLTANERYRIPMCDTILTSLGKTWKIFFDEVLKSDFLLKNKGPWLNLDWIVSEAHFENIINGKYRKNLERRNYGISRTSTIDDQPESAKDVYDETIAAFERADEEAIRNGRMR